ncbi:MAG: chorismate mutase, partial [Planctomycetota bacterium]
SVLRIFEERGINLTHIDKRPMKSTSWNYTFFLDAQGHRNDESMQEALGEAAEHCSDFIVLGSYPRSRRIL